MSKQDDTTHIYILAVHILVAVAIFVTYFDIKREINEIKDVSIPELRTQILQEL